MKKGITKAHTICFILFLLNFASLVNAQPYYYYANQQISEDETEVFSEVYRFNFATNTKELFFSDSVWVYDLGWDPTQKWIYYWRECYGPDRGTVILINSERPTEKYALPFDGRVTVYGIFFLPQKKRIFMTTWIQNMVFDYETFAPIDSFDFEINFFTPLYDFSSEDGSMIYTGWKDTTTSYHYLQGISTETHQIVWQKREIEIGHHIEPKVSLGGKKGIALYGYMYPEGEDKKRHAIAYSTSLDRVLCDISLPFINDFFLSGDAKYLIFEETPLNTNRRPSDPLHLHPGRFWIYEITTGKLIQKLFLPPNGKALVFDNYPNMLYYYLPSEQRSINIDLSKLTSIILLNPTFANVGTGSFTLTVTGKNFVSGSTVYWSNQPKPTIFISDSILEATIPASDLAVPDTVFITVKSQDGTTESNSVKFYILAKQTVEELIESIRKTLRDQSNKGNIGNQKFVSELDELLINAKRKYAKKDSIGCTQELEELQQIIRNEYLARPKKNDKRYINAEAYRLLTSDITNIISNVLTLPPRISGTIYAQISALQTELKRAETAEQISGKILIPALNLMLEISKKEIQKKDTTGAALQIRLFQRTIQEVYELTQKLKKTKDRIYITATAYISLYYRAEYILEQLTEISNQTLPKLEFELEKELQELRKEVVE